MATTSTRVSATTPSTLSTRNVPMAALMNGMSETSSAVIVRYEPIPAPTPRPTPHPRVPDPHLPRRPRQLERIARRPRTPFPTGRSNDEHRTIRRGPRNARRLSHVCRSARSALDLQRRRRKPLPLAITTGCGRPTGRSDSSMRSATDRAEKAGFQYAARSNVAGRWPTDRTSDPSSPAARLTQPGGDRGRESEVRWHGRVRADLELNVAAHEHLRLRLNRLRSEPTMACDAVNTANAREAATKKSIAIRTMMRAF